MARGFRDQDDETIGPLGKTFLACVSLAGCMFVTFAVQGLVHPEEPSKQWWYESAPRSEEEFERMRTSFMESQRSVNLMRMGFGALMFLGGQYFLFLLKEDAGDEFAGG